MTDRQQTGVWFVITGVLLLSLWVFAYAIVDVLNDTSYFAANAGHFSPEQQYILGASGVVSVQLASVTGVPFLITGLIQVITGAKPKKNSKK